MTHRKAVLRVQFLLVYSLSYEYVTTRDKIGGSLVKYTKQVQYIQLSEQGW